MKKNNIFENFTHKKGVLTVLIIILGFIFGLVYNSCFSIKEYKSNVSITNSYNVDDMQFNTIRDFVFLDNTINELCKYIEQKNNIKVENNSIRKNISIEKSKIDNTEIILSFKNSEIVIIQPVLKYLSSYLVETLNSTHNFTFYLTVSSVPSNLKYINKSLKEIFFSVVINIIGGWTIILIIEKFDGKIHNLKDIQKIDCHLYMLN